MKNIINIYKPVGISPLDAINLLKEKNPQKFLKHKDTPITYAGRLDPMAEGVLLLLSGNEVHKADEYMKLDKEYEAEILFGFQTDTYDILGISEVLWLIIVPEDLKKEIQSLKGEISLPLPPYSSYKIKGRPLFMWAREGRLDEIEIPERATQIYEAKVLDSYEISSEELLKQIIEKIEKVKGDFRQNEILSKWQEVLCDDPLQKLDFENRLSLNLLRKSSTPIPYRNSTLFGYYKYLKKFFNAPEVAFQPTILKSSSLRSYLIVKAKFNVSSGTYIRSIAHHLGGVLLSLKRTKVGEFDMKDSIKLS